MSARILDGKTIAADVRGEIRAQADDLRHRGVTPGLGVLLVGEDPASRSYVSAKEAACAELGLYSRETHLPASAALEAILAVVRDYNADDRIHGILVQLPLPQARMEQTVLEAIDPAKDVDGFAPVSVGRMMLGLPTFLPCTPHGVVRMLQWAGIPVAGAHAVIVGRSHIVGRPLANMLSQKSETGNATVTLCHTATRDLRRHTLQADILIAAAGRPATIAADMVREGAVVIDVGVNRVPAPDRPKGFRLVGDVDFEAVRARASAITPVPGGVGPMTITMLMHNTVLAARRRAGDAGA